MLAINLRHGQSGIKGETLFIKKCEPFYAPRIEQFDWAEEKIDGHRIVLTREGAFTTRGHNIATKIWYFDRMARVISEGESIDGELYSYDGGAEQVKTLLAQGGHGTSFKAFGSSKFKDSDSILRARESLSERGFDVPKLLPANLADVKSPRWEDHEGWIFKSTLGDPWMKFKFEKTIDLVVVKLKTGGGRSEKYVGTVGSLICATSEGHVVADVGGLPDEVRFNLSDQDIGRVIEVKYQRVGTRGRLRHPRFVRWRDDKSIEGCSMAQDQELSQKWS